MKNDWHPLSDPLPCMPGKTPAAVRMEERERIVYPSLPEVFAALPPSLGYGGRDGTQADIYCLTSLRDAGSQEGAFSFPRPGNTAGSIPPEGRQHAIGFFLAKHPFPQFGGDGFEPPGYPDSLGVVTATAQDFFHLRRDCIFFFHFRVAAHFPGLPVSAMNLALHSSRSQFLRIRTRSQ
jgi:hypothetical protein